MYPNAAHLDEGRNDIRSDLRWWSSVLLCDTPATSKLTTIVVVSLIFFLFCDSPILRLFMLLADGSAFPFPC